MELGLVVVVEEGKRREERGWIQPQAVVLMIEASEGSRERERTWVERETIQKRERVVHKN